MLKGVLILDSNKLKLLRTVNLDGQLKHFSGHFSINDIKQQIYNENKYIFINAWFSI